MDSSVKYQKFVVSKGDDESKDGKRERNSKYIIILGILLVTALVAAVSVVAVAIGVGVGVQSVSQASESKQTESSASGLTAITITQGELEGEYHGSEGGIHFQSVVNATYFVLSITTTSGEPILLIIHPLTSNMTMMGVNDTNFMVMENQPGRPQYDDYVIPKDAMNLMESIMMGEREMSDDVLEHFDNKTVNETRQSVLNNLAVSQEALLITEAAQALGSLGIQGSEYPAVMRFYLLALRLASARGGTEGSSITTDGNVLKERRQKRQLVRCSSNGRTCNIGRCPTGSGCFGQCGYGCSCWTFVCGDCCVHEYCRTHDRCCADRGFWSWACLSVAWRVLGSRCSDRYRC